MSSGADKDKTQMEEQAIQAIWDAITNLNHAYTAMAIDVAVVKSQVGEMVWLMRTVTVVSIGFIVTRFWKMIMDWKHNHK